MKSRRIHEALLREYGSIAHPPFIVLSAEIDTSRGGTDYGDPFC
jgi:hypothetical protein